MERLGACQFVLNFFREFLLKVRLETLSTELCLAFDEKVRCETFWTEPCLQFSIIGFIRSLCSTEPKKGFKFVSAESSFVESINQCFIFYSRIRAITSTYGSKR